MSPTRTVAVETDGVNVARPSDEGAPITDWSAPRYYAYPDTEDARLLGMFGVYEANGFPYESMWFNFLSMSCYVRLAFHLRNASLYSFRVE